MGFACSGCGACCRRVDAVPEARHLDRGDGACRYLTAENACSIYNERPRVCRVDEMRPAVLTEPEWHRRNHDACGRLQLQVYGQQLRR